MSTPAPATTEWVPLWDLNGGVGLDYKGAWSSTTSYRDGDIVVHSGLTYVAVRPNLNKIPTPWPTAPTYDTAWHIVGAAGEPAYQNGYSAWDGRSPRFRKLSSGLVIFSGIVRTPGAATTNPAWVMPAGYRCSDPSDQAWAINSSSTFGICNIFANGNVTFATVVASSWAYLNGVSYYADS